MKTFAISLVGAVMLAVTTSSPTLADAMQRNVELGSGWSCPPNAIRCTRPYHPRHPRCFTVTVRDHRLNIQKKRVCTYQ